MALTQELIFASEAHANAAVNSINTAKGLSGVGADTWDIPVEITTGVWRIARPDDGSDSGVTNIVATQTLGYAKKQFLYNEDGANDTILPNENGEPLENEPITLE